MSTPEPKELIHRDTGRRWRMRVGFLSLLSGIALIGYGMSYRSRVRFLPVNVPLSFDSLTPVVTTFMADTRTKYTVGIDVQRTLPFETLSKLKLPPMIWSVKSGGRTVSRSYGGSEWGGTVDYDIGRFDAEPGQRYTVRLALTRPAPGLQVLRPRLHVQMSPATEVRLSVKAMATTLLGIFLLIPSAVILIWGRKASHAASLPGLSSQPS